MLENCHQPILTRFSGLGVLCSSALCAMLLFMSVYVHAHEGATGIVKERMDSMVVMGDASKAIVAMFKGKKPYNAKALVDYGVEINEHSIRLLDLFPKGSLKHPSKARAVIWEKWDKFESLAYQLQNKSQQFVEVAKQGNKKTVRKQFGQIGKTCKDCHKVFRKPKKSKK